LKSKGGEVPLIKKLVTFFNTETGRLSKNRSELDIIALIVDNKFRKPKKEDVVRNLRIVEQDVAKLHFYKLNDIHAKINAICKLPLTKMKAPIEALSDYLKSKVNETAKEFLARNNRIEAFIVNPFNIKDVKGGAKPNPHQFIARLVAEKSGLVDKRIAKGKSARPKMDKEIDIRKMKQPSKWLQEHYPPAKKAGRPVKHATEEEKYKAKLLSNKLKRQEKRAKAKANVELVVEEKEPTKEELMKELAKRLSKPSFVRNEDLV
jgi:hypothetical protein